MRNYRFLWLVILGLSLFAGKLWVDGHRRTAPASRGSNKSASQVDGWDYGWETVANVVASAKYWDQQYGGFQLVGTFPPGEYRTSASGRAEILVTNSSTKERGYQPISPEGVPNAFNREDLLPSKPRFSLLARIGDLSPIHFGKDGQFMIYQNEGEQQLRLGLNLPQNEADCTSNRGQFSVKIERRK